MGAAQWGQFLAVQAKVKEMVSLGLLTITPAGLALIDDANASAQLTTLGVSTFIKTLLDDADAIAARTTLGVTWEQIGPAITISNVASVIWTDLSAYRRIRVSGRVKTVSTAFLYGHVSTDNGATYLTGAGEYVNHFHYASSATPAAAVAGYPQMFLNSIAALSTYGTKFEVTLDDFNQAVTWMGNSISFMVGSSFYGTSNTSFVSASTTARDAFRLTASTGNLNSGYVIMEGIRG